MESRLAALEMQIKEVMSHTSPSSFSVTTTHPRTYSACVDNGIQNKQRQQQHVPHPAVVRWVGWRERESQHCLPKDRLYST